VRVNAHTEQSNTEPPTSSITQSDRFAPIVKWSVCAKLFRQLLATSALPRENSIFCDPSIAALLCVAKCGETVSSSGSGIARPAISQNTVADTMRLLRARTESLSSLETASLCYVENSPALRKREIVQRSLVEQKKALIRSALRFEELFSQLIITKRGQNQCGVLCVSRRGVRPGGETPNTQKITKHKNHIVHEKLKSMRKENTHKHTHTQS
jgi:hypothetical protein